MKFTKTNVEKLEPQTKGKYYVRADMGTSQKHGFALCVYPSGKKSWFFIYTLDGRRNSLCLGHYPELGIAEAGKKFEEQWLIFSAGKNPAIIQQVEQHERLKSPTVKVLAQEYVERHAQIHKKSWKEDERYLNVEVISVWGNRKAQDISKRDIIALLDKIVDRGAPHSADSIFKILRKMFNWAVENDLLTESPCVSIKRKIPPSKKIRVLSPDEIKILWNALGSSVTSEANTTMSTGVKNAIKLILITAQRPGEVCGMHTSEIQDKWWTIPAEKSKNKVAHRVPLTNLAQELIDESIRSIKISRKIPNDSEYCGYVFPTPHKKKDKPIDRHALSKAIKRNHDDGLTFGLQPFTPHDLRRTAATMLAELKEMNEVIDAVLNHIQQGIIKVYNQYRYDREKQIALEKLAGEISKILAPPKRPIYRLTPNGKERIVYPDGLKE